MGFGIEDCVVVEEFDGQNVERLRAVVDRIPQGRCIDLD